MKRGVRVAAKEAMQRFNYDPLEVLILHAQDASTSSGVKLEIAETLLPYMYPKLSNITVEGEVVSNTNAESQAVMLRRILANPELADAAQRLSIAAAESALEYETNTAGLGPSDIGGMIQ
jgi:hypothetical protein